MAPVKKKTNGYWQGEVDTLLKGLASDSHELKVNFQTYITDNSRQHDEIQKNIGTLRERAAKWGGVAGLLVSIGAFLALLLLSHVVK